MVQTEGFATRSQYIHKQSSDSTGRTCRFVAEFANLVLSIYPQTLSLFKSQGPLWTRLCEHVHACYATDDYNHAFAVVFYHSSSVSCLLVLQLSMSLNANIISCWIIRTLLKLYNIVLRLLSQCLCIHCGILIRCSTTLVSSWLITCCSSVFINLQTVINVH